MLVQISWILYTIFSYLSVSPGDVMLIKNFDAFLTRALVSINSPFTLGKKNHALFVLCKICVVHFHDACADNERILHFHYFTTLLFNDAMFVVLKIDLSVNEHAHANAYTG